MQLNTIRKVDKYLGFVLLFFLIPVTRVLGKVLRRNHSLNTPPEQVVFIKLLGLGSLVLASESIQHIRHKFPNTRLVLLTDKNLAAGIRHFISFDEEWVVPAGSFFSVALKALVYLYKCWKQKNVWVVDLEVYSKLTTVYSLMTLAVNRFGFALGPVFFRKFLNTHNVAFDQSKPMEFNYLKIAEAVTQSEVIYRERNLVRKEEISKPYIAINNTCSELALVRKLEKETLIQICSWLLQNTSYKLAFLGASTDVNDNEVIIKNLFFQERTENLAGKLDFENYYNFLEKKCSFIITIDSAPLHIAKKLGLPTISAWGPTDPASYLQIDPWETNRHFFVYNKVHCSPCVHKYSKLPCSGDNKCMKDMEAEAIISTIKQLLLNLDHPQSVKPNSPVFVG